MTSGRPTGNSRSSVAEHIASVLADSGIEMVFGLPGGENLQLLTALHRQGVQFYLTHHESAAVYMAATVARIRRTLGVVLTTLGPGAANAVPGMSHAFLDRSPVLLLTAETAESAPAVYTHQRLSLHALFQPISKYSATVAPDTVAATLTRAIRHAQSGRPGPVHLALSSESAAAPAEPAGPWVQPTVAGPFTWQIKSARRLLSRSRRPLIVVGLGVEPEAPYRELQSLAEAVDAPVITTPKAKGALSADHPLAAGTIGLTMTDPSYSLLAKADCVLAVGLDVVELVRPWDIDAPLIWLAPWPNENPVLSAAAQLVGSLRRGLRNLHGLTVNVEREWGPDRAAEGITLRNPSPSPPEYGRAYPQQIMAAVYDTTPPSTQVVVDVGAHKILASLAWPSRRPNSFHLSNGLSVMGYGIAGAIGAARCQEDLVVCLTGDGGLAMAAGELTGLRGGLTAPLVIVVFNDGALELIRTKQERANLPQLGTRFLNPDFHALARAYGLAYVLVSSYDTCAAAMLRAQEDPMPTIIEAVIDPSSYPTAASA